MTPAHSHAAELLLSGRDAKRTSDRVAVLGDAAAHRARRPRRHRSRERILVNEHLQTSVPVCSQRATWPVQHPFYGERVRVGHLANALNQRPLTARVMLHRGDVYDRLRYFLLRAIRNRRGTPASPAPGPRHVPR